MDNEKRAGGLRGAWKRQSAAQQQAAEKRRLGPALQALKALHSVGTPGSMNAEELERQRRMQDIIGHLAAPMAGLSWEPFSLNGMNAAWMRRKAPHKRRRAILYPRRRLHQRQSGLFPYSGLQAGQCHRI